MTPAVRQKTIVGQVRVGRTTWNVTSTLNSDPDRWQGIADKWAQFLLDQLTKPADGGRTA